MSSIKKRKGSDNWYIRYYVGGKPKEKSLGVTTKREALELQRIFDARVAAAKVGQPTESKVGPKRTYTLNNLIADLGKMLRRTIAASTAKNYGDRLKAVAAHFGADRNIYTIQREEVLEYRAAALSGGTMPRTINGNIGAARAVLNKASEAKLYHGANPFQGIRKLKELPSVDRAMTTKEEDALMEAAQRMDGYRGPSDRRNMEIFVLLGRYAGMRKAEILNAELSWFDLERKTISIVAKPDPKDKVNPWFRVKSGDRTLPMHDRIHEYIAKNTARFKVRPLEGRSGRDLREVRANYLLEPENGPRKDSTGRILDRWGYRNQFDYIAKQIGAEWLTPHIMRHTFITKALEKGVPIEVVGQWVGHNSVYMTKHYAHIRPEAGNINLVG